MKNPFSHSVLRRAARWSALALGVTVAGLTAEACSVDRMLTVQDIDVATPGSLSGVSGLPVVYAGGVSEFMVALTGTDHAITMPGLLTDELRDIDTFPTRIEVDQRNIQITNGTVQTWYRQMHRARAALERGTAAFEQYAPTDKRKIELHALDGFVYVMFAEDFCNGVAYSTFGDQPVYGPANSGKQSLALAIAQFDSALAQAGATDTLHYLAEIGKARAQIDLGGAANFAAAAATVKDVPVTFVYNIRNSANSSTENSGVYINVGPPSKRFAVADLEGTNGLGFRTEGYNATTQPLADGRVKWYKDTKTGQDGSSVAYYQLKYPDYASNVPLATGIEAKLIIAEALLATNPQATVDTLNYIRTSLAGNAVYQPVPAATLTLQATATAQQDQLFHERAFWLFLTGHRLGDMRRLVWQYNRGAETVFPTGTYTGNAGGSYGADVNFPITVDENNNTAAPTCTDRSANFGQ